MSGYWQQPKVGKAIADGWFRRRHGGYMDNETYRDDLRPQGA